MRFINVLTGVLLSGILAGPTLAQNVASTGSIGKASSVGTEDEKKEIGFTKGGFVAAPIPIKNPTLGTGLALGGGYLFNLDESSANSYLGLGGFRTDNGSQGYGLSGDIAWDQNRWSLGLTVGELDLFYDLYYGGRNRYSVPLKQKGKIANFTLKYGFTENIILGLNTAYVESSIGLNGADSLPGFLDKSLDLKIYKIGPTFDLEYRDDTIYPTRGYHTSFSGNYNALESPTGDGNYTKAVLKHDAYTNFNDGMVVATRFTGCSVSDSTPFFEKCGLGSVDSFRGFAFGEVLNDSLLSFQTELRGRVGKRFGYVFFAGLGTAAKDFSSMKTDEIRTSGGVGVRIRLSQKFPMDFSLDYAHADNGNGSYYIYVGQRF